MNMIAGAKVSIVDPTPGVTRDRVSAIVVLDPPVKFKGDRDDRDDKPKTVEFVDTGGFGAYTAPGERFDEVGADLHTLTNSIEFQIAEAVHGADLVLFVLDAQSGVTPQDEAIAKLLREGKLGPQHKQTTKKNVPEADPDAKGTKKTTKKAGKKAAGFKIPPIQVVTNKTDGPKWEAHAAEAAGLGFGEPIVVSAKNNYMRREFMDRVFDMLPIPSKHLDAQADLKIAIVGKRNAGKSTLINTLAGEPRVIVSEIAGTTRDAIDVRFDMDMGTGEDGKPVRKSVLAIDTAGVRRAKSFQSMVEHFAFDRVQRAIERADVVLLMIDATEKVSQVDEQVAMLCQKGYKPTIIVVSKWDLTEGKPNKKGLPIVTGDYEDYLRKELGGLTYAPIAFISGKSGRNVKQTLKLAMDLKEQAAERVTTGKLNRIVRKIMEKSAPTDTKGTHAKVLYVAQTWHSPPTITLVVNHPELFRPGFLRFLMNRFREELPFVEVPMRIVVRARRQREDDIPMDPEAMVETREGVQRKKGKHMHLAPVPDKNAGVWQKKMAKSGATPDARTDDLIDRELSPEELAQFADDAETYFDD